MRNQPRAADWRDTFHLNIKINSYISLLVQPWKSITSMVKRVIYICHLKIKSLKLKPPPPQYFLYKMFGVGGSAASALTWSIWEIKHQLQNQDLMRGQYLSCQQVVVHYSDWSSIQFHDLGLHEACTCVLPDPLLCWWIFSLTYWRWRAETCRHQGSGNGDICPLQMSRGSLDYSIVFSQQLVKDPVDSFLKSGLQVCVWDRCFHICNSAPSSLKLQFSIYLTINLTISVHWHHLTAWFELLIKASFHINRYVNFAFRKCIYVDCCSGDLVQKWSLDHSAQVEVTFQNLDYVELNSSPIDLRWIAYNECMELHF